MRRFAVVGVAVFIGVLVFAPSGLAASARVAALQVALHAHGFDPAPVDGVRGRSRPAPDRVPACTGHPRHGARRPRTRRALGALGRPLLGQRELGVGAVGWDVSSLEFRLIPYGLDAQAVDGRFTRSTAVALAASRRRGLPPTASPGSSPPLARRPGRRLVTRRPGTSSSRARASSRSRSVTASARAARAPQRALALHRDRPGQRLALPEGARLTAPAAAGPPATAMPCAHRSTTGRASTASTRARARDRVDGVGLPAERRLERRRDRRHAAPARRPGPGSIRCCSARDAANLRRQRPRRRPLPPLAARPVQRRPPARARGLLPGRPGGARPRAVRRHEALRRDHPQLYGTV